MKHLYEELRVDAVVLPAAVTGAVAPIGYFDMQNYDEALIVVTAVLGGGESVTVQARESSSAAGADLANLGAAITIDDPTNPIAIINVNTDAMSNGTRFLSALLTTIGGAVEVSAVILRGEPRYQAVEQDVDEGLVID